MLLLALAVRDMAERAIFGPPGGTIAAGNALICAGFVPIRAGSRDVLLSYVGSGAGSAQSGTARPLGLPRSGNGRARRQGRGEARPSNAAPRRKRARSSHRRDRGRVDAALLYLRRALPLSLLPRTALRKCPIGKDRRIGSAGALTVLRPDGPSGIAVPARYNRPRCRSTSTSAWSARPISRSSCGTARRRSAQTARRRT